MVPASTYTSRLFAEMFSLPQQPQSSITTIGSEAAVSDAPIIPVAEDSETLERLLRMCYPVHRPTIDPHTVILTLGAARKYDMPVVTGSLTSSLLSYKSSDPLYVFAVAYKLDLEDILEDAVREFTATRRPANLSKGRGPPAQTVISLAHSLHEYSREMDTLPAAVYYRLLEHHSTTSPDSPRPASSSFQAAVRFIISRPRAPEGLRSAESVVGQLSHPFEDNTRADTIIRSSDNIIFHVDCRLLAFASPVFSQVLCSPPKMSASNSSETSQGITSPNGDVVHHFPEDGKTLSRLLQLSYPMSDPQLFDSSGPPGADILKDAISLYNAARKYEVARAIAFAKRACIDAAKASPVQLYLLAVQYHWDEVAKDAALRAVYETSDRYFPEMEYASAAAYRRLLVYRRKCRDIILSGGEFYSASPDGRGTLEPEPRRRSAYWSKSPWLNNSGEAHFWLAFHERVHLHNARSIEGITVPIEWMDIEATLPSSVLMDVDRAAPVRPNPTRTESPGSMAPTPIPEHERHDELRRIADQLGKVEL
ncbi:hypothetical protein DAEQUDRAFT_728629 [Daedalea quercina L-15889]|uniref:BTB domain-containing protein n=1 Tax=Daedalea quercina L-15889 TaxID=1314783 RepID=A0A165P7C4_9APHY|nr:hypothetical protein DAEQUDRAFT_728629 [Daedalea quercina L-15889]